MSQPTRALGACVALFLLAGCSIGPKFVPDPAFPSAGSDLRNRKVIVSGFQGARYSTSVTRDANIQTIREAIGTRDISPDVAQGLRARGIDAEARVGVQPAMLKRGEVLLRGKVSAFGGPGWSTDRGANWANLVLVTVTLGIVGMIGPTPIPWTVVVHVTYSADVVDAQGRFLAHASEQRVDAEFDSYYFWGSNYGDVNERTFAAGTQRVTERLADWFVDGRPAGGAGAARR
jgi:hypothetical protein